MTEVFTILRVVFSLGYYAVVLPTEMDCGLMLPAVHEMAMTATNDPFGVYLMSQCIPTGAPSQIGTRPIARGRGT